MIERTIDIALVAVAIAGAVWTYQIKHEAELSAKRIASIKTQIAAQNRKIVLLEADWAIETSPKRLSEVSKRFEKQLALRPMESMQIIELHELPQLREAPTDEEVETWAGKNDETATGGIEALIEKENGR